MRAYNVAAAAEALDVDVKQIDNLLSRHEIPGVHRERQGIPRRLSPDAIVIIRIAFDLARSTRVPLDVALRLAAELERHGGEAVMLGDGVWLGADLEKLRANTGERLDRAVEVVVQRHRGRPPASGRTLAPAE